MRWLGFLVSSLSCLVLTAVAAEVSTPDGIHITAETTVADFKDGTITYTGNVTVTRGDVVLNADQIIEKRKNGERTEVVALGDPVLFRDGSPDPGGIERGTAKKVVYSAVTAQIELTNFILVDTDGNSTGGITGVYRLNDS
ncbi:MAG: LptA/OstA family protein [Pseudomonadota bacterium]